MGKNSNIKFKIICIEDFFGVTKGEIFETDNYEFNYLSGNLRLIKDGYILGVFKKENFMKLEDYRNKVIGEILM
jgi:hypothetical protein